MVATGEPGTACGRPRQTGAMTDEVRVRHVPGQGRYEAQVGGELAGFVSYEVRGDETVLVHTEVRPEAEGQGVGAALVRGTLEDLRDRGARVVAACSFVQAFIGRHPEYGDLVGGSGPGRSEDE